MILLRESSARRNMIAHMMMSNWLQLNKIPKLFNSGHLGVNPSDSWENVLISWLIEGIWPNTLNSNYPDKP